MKQEWIDAGFDFEYEEHAMSLLLPRSLFDTHPEYFRMDEDGVRRSDGNGCPSSTEGLEVMASNVEDFAKSHMPTNHRYYTWLFDGGDICHCPLCKDYSASDQGLIFENRIIKALKELDPEAKLAHLAYHSTTPAPTKVKPEPDIFLEFAPFYRSWSEPLSKRDAAVRPGRMDPRRLHRYAESESGGFPRRNSSGSRILDGCFARKRLEKTSETAYISRGCLP